MLNPMCAWCGQIREVGDRGKIRERQRIVHCTLYCTCTCVCVDMIVWDLCVCGEDHVNVPNGNFSVETT